MPTPLENIECIIDSLARYSDDVVLDNQTPSAELAAESIKTFLQLLENCTTWEVWVTGPVKWRILPETFPPYHELCLKHWDSNFTWDTLPRITKEMALQLLDWYRDVNPDATLDLVGTIHYQYAAKRITGSDDEE